MSRRLVDELQLQRLIMIPFWPSKEDEYYEYARDGLGSKPMEEYYEDRPPLLSPSRFARSELVLPTSNHHNQTHTNHTTNNDHHNDTHNDDNSLTC